jgi:cobalt/nickel transport system permease protein
VGAGHAHPLYLPGSSPVHRLPAEVKIVGAFLVVLCVVATPREAFAVFGGYLLLLAAVWGVARIPPGWIARRALIEAPFVVLAVLLPITGGAPHVEWFGLTLSEPGLLGAWNILVKGTLGVLTSLTLAATTPLRDLLLGLQRLHAPALVVTIATLMLRYVDVIVGEARRMRLARISRGHDPRFLWQAGATAQGVGSLFVRSYERRTSGREWLAGLAPAAIALVLATASWVLS